MASIRVTAGPEANGEPVRLGDSPFVVGRAHTCDLQISDALSSRKHFQIRPYNGGFAVEDLGSRNGTLLNGQKVAALTPLKTGDVMKVGDAEITFDAADAQTPPPPISVPSHATNTDSKADSNSGDEGPFGAPGTVYELRFSGRGGTFVRVLENPVTTVGRGDDADIQIKETLASRVHCQFEVKSAGIKVVDLESRNGTQVNGETVNQKFLSRNDRIQIGETVIEVAGRPPVSTQELLQGPLKYAPEAERPTVADDPPARPIHPPGADHAPRLVYAEGGAQHVLALNRQEIIVGRSEKVDLTLKENLASREHFAIRRLPNGAYELEDLNSRNGTRLNGREVRGRIQIVDGDVIQVGDVALRFVTTPGSAVLSAPIGAVPSSAVAPPRPASSAGAGAAAAAVVDEGASAPRRRRRGRAGGGGGGSSAVPAILGAAVVVVFVVIIAISMGGARDQTPDPAPTPNIIAGNQNPPPRNTPTPPPPNRPPRNVPPSNGGGTTPPVNHAGNHGTTAPSNRPASQYDDAWVNDPRINELERAARRAWADCYLEVDVLLRGDTFGPAVKKLEAFVVEWEFKIGGKEMATLATRELDRVKREAGEDWRRNYLPKIQATAANERVRRWKAEVDERFGGIEGIMAEAQELFRQ